MLKAYILYFNSGLSQKIINNLNGNKTKETHILRGGDETRPSLYFYF